MTNRDDELELRAFARQDFARLLRWVESPAMLVQWAGPSLFRWPLDEAQLERYRLQAEAQRSRSRVFTAAGAEGGEPVGHVELAAIDREDLVAVLCRVLVDPERRGQGVGTRMTRAALRFGFEELGLRRIELRVYDVNPGAIRCYEKAGFVRKGLLPELQPVGGDLWGVVVMAVDRARWAAAGPRRRPAG